MGNGATSASKASRYKAPEPEVHIVKVEPNPQEDTAPPVYVYTAPEEPPPAKSPIRSPRLSLTEVDERDIMEVLQMAREEDLRKLPISTLKLLAETAQLKDYPAKTFIDGAQMGRCLVLNGEATVTFAAEGQKMVIAVLRRGDSFAWTRLQDALEEPHFEPGIILITVNKASPLRVCYLDDVEPGLERLPSKHVQHLLSVNSISLPRSHDAGGLSDLLSRLWLGASPPVTGIADACGGILRAHFLVSLWSPFLSQLDEHKAEIRQRIEKGYRKHDCFPLQGRQIVEMRDHLRHLTEIWYGTSRGCNISVLYKWFVECMELVGVTAYSMDAIPQERTADSWATVVDGGARAAALKGKGASDAEYVASGGLAQRQGRSAIDNTVLRNVLLPREARELLVGRKFRKVLCMFLSLQQRCILRRLGEVLQLDLVRLANQNGPSRDHAAVCTVLQHVQPEVLAAARVNPQHLAFKQLKLRGTILAGFGQLEPGEQLGLWEVACRMVNPKHGPAKDSPPKTDSEDIWERFVAHCRDRPGEFFEGSKSRHSEVKIAGMISRNIIVVKRSAMERFSLARYFPIHWTRTQPLWSVNTNGRFQVRPKDVWEVSHVRANECPYANLHGMSLAGGGHVDSTRRERRRSTVGLLLHELQWVRDPAANVENWMLTDIEKIIHEGWHLNPHGPKEMLLPGETFVTVGQNPKVGSSIKQTQHTQLYAGSLSTYPVLGLSSSSGPRASKKLAASVDVVNVGPDGAADDQCGTIIRLFATQPASPAIAEFLVGLRLHLLTVFGGGEVIDFLVLCFSDERGGFGVLFAAIPQLLKLDDKHPDHACWANPLTGESSESAMLHEVRVDVGKGVGHFLVAKPELRSQLLEGGEDFVRRVWAFNRVPGAREEIDRYILEQQIFDDDDN